MKLSCHSNRYTDQVDQRIISLGILFTRLLSSDRYSERMKRLHERDASSFEAKGEVENRGGIKGVGGRRDVEQEGG